MRSKTEIQFLNSQDTVETFQLVIGHDCVVPHIHRLMLYLPCVFCANKTAIMNQDPEILYTLHIGVWRGSQKINIKFWKNHKSRNVKSGFYFILFNVQN